MEKGDVLDYIYLAILTSKDCSEYITYIVKSTKMQKGKPSKTDLPY